MCMNVSVSMYVCMHKYLYVACMNMCCYTQCTLVHVEHIRHLIRAETKAVLMPNQAYNQIV